MIENPISFMNDYEKWRVTDHKGVYSGTPLDNIARVQKGDFVAIVGAAKGGKSTFIHWYIAQMTMVADWHIALVDFESESGEVFDQISALTNPHHTATHIHPITNVASVEEVIYDVEQAKELYDIDCVVIDPYSNLMGREVNTYTINADLALLQAMAKRLDVVVILMCHPTKSTGKGEDKLSLYSVTGSAAFAQRVDLGLTIKSDYDNYTTTITAEMVRHSQRGKMGGVIELSYNPKAHNFTLSDTDNALDMMFPTEQTVKPQPKVDVERKVNFTELQELQVNYYPKATSNDGGNRRTVRLLESVNTTDPEIVEFCKYLREHVGEFTDKEKQDYKRIHFPVVTPSAIFLPDADNRKVESIQNFTNVIAIDIDLKDNRGKSLAELRTITNKTPYVFYSAVSVSGQGLFALIRLDSVDSPDTFREYFSALEEYFKCRGVVIDGACKDPTRLRYVTNDPNPYTNENALVWTYRTPVYIPMKYGKNFNVSDVPKKRFVTTSTLTDAQKMDFIISDVTNNGIIINPTHSDTLTMSAAIANTFGADGWDYFAALNTPKHGYDAADVKYQDIYQQDVSSPKREAAFGSIVDLYKRAKNIDTVDWTSKS